jgi:hypothetical protein
MSSDREEGIASRGEPHVLRGIGDPVVGLLIWAAYFLVVYVAFAVACVIGLGLAEPGVQTGFRVGLAALTVVSLAGIAAHGIARWRSLHTGFMARLAVTLDFVAFFAVLWMLSPILTVPVCR